MSLIYEKRNTKDGYLYTIGNSKATVIFMEKISHIDTNTRNSIVKLIERYFRMIKSVEDNKFKAHLSHLVYNDVLSIGTQILKNHPELISYFINIIKTKLKPAK